MDDRATIRRYILEEFLPGEPAASLEDDMSLKAGGIIDSMGTLKLVQFVEETFGISVEAHESDEANFGSVDSVVAFVAAKKEG